MTIRTSINAAELSDDLGHFQRCAEEAPDGAFAQAHQVADVIARAANSLITELRCLGLRADNCDLIREVEAVVYGYIKASNPGENIFPLAEGFGEALTGPERERILQQLQMQTSALQNTMSIQ